MLHFLRFSLQNAVYFIMLPFLVLVLFTFYIQKCVTGISPGGKGGRCVGLTYLSPCADRVKCLDPQSHGTLRACPPLYKDCFVFKKLGK